MSEIASLTSELRQFVAERDWQQFHDPKNLAMLLASEVGELVAEYRWVSGAVADEHSRADAARERIRDEIGDV
ncbi:MAG: nucleotide pyrophosphohydrolase, partial [Solimonas sp.]